MRGRRAIAVVIACGAGFAHAEPTPQKVDIKPFRDELVVLTDAANNFYVVKPFKPAAGGKPEDKARVWFGAPGKPIYEQRVTSRSTNGQRWDLATWAPRIPEMRPGYFRHNADGTYERGCGIATPTPLTQLTGDKAKAVLDKQTLMTEFLMRRPHMLARDDRGTYYYVDKLTQSLGGKSFRVFVGKKGAMKQMPLSDVATDSAGEVFATKTGDLRLDHTQEGTHMKVGWIRGEKRIELIALDPDLNSPLIFSDLGIYPFLGTICDNV